MNALPSYALSTEWRHYLRFYPPPYLARLDDVVEERWSWRGMDLHVDRMPNASAAAKLIIVHGAGGYGRLFVPLGARLHAEIVAPDLPGYGLSHASRTHGRGRTVDYDDWVDCIVDLVAREQAKDDRPIVLLGGSMGGMLAYSVAARTPVSGLIVTCLLDPRRAEVRDAVARSRTLMRLGLPLLGVRLLQPLLDRIRLPIRWLTHMSRMGTDPALGALCATDPLGGGNWVSLRWLRTFMDSKPPVEPEDFDACPVLMAHPACDSWTPVSVSLPFFERLRVEKRLVLLEGGGHCPVEPTALAALERCVGEFLVRVPRQEQANPAMP